MLPRGGENGAPSVAVSFPLSRFGGPLGLPRVFRAAGMVLRSALGALRGVLFGVLEAPRTLFRRSARAFSGPPIVLEVTWGVAGMVHWGFTVRLGINGQNPYRPLSISLTVRICFGVGGSGRSRVECKVCCLLGSVQTRSKRPGNATPVEILVMRRTGKVFRCREMWSCEDVAVSSSGNVEMLLAQQ